MPIIHTDSLDSKSSLSSMEEHQTYCGLDSCVTLEVWQALQPQRQRVEGCYTFQRALQAPYMEIMQRGFAVDETARRNGVENLHRRLAVLDGCYDGKKKLTQPGLLQTLAQAVWDKPLNPRSPVQLKDFFYIAMALPEVWLSQKGEKKLSTNREALEKLDSYMHARPFVQTILRIRDIGKQLDVLEMGMDLDARGGKRFRAGYNVAGTETGRPSSSGNAFGTGGNAQNIAPGLRHIFIADAGWKLCCIDLEQVEARDVGWICGCLFDDWTFLDNCESGDLHSNNAKLIWPGLDWTGDPKADRAVAEQNFYRDFSYRDMAKRGGHLCLTSDHEVLTKNGWVSIASQPNEILSWSKSEARFEKVQNWTAAPYTGDLHSFQGTSMDLKMTSNHRVPYTLDGTSGLIRTKLAKDGPGKFMPLGGGYIGGEETPPARLIAAFMSDGYQKSTNRMEFHLKKERKIKRLKMLCEAYGYPYEVKGDKITVHGALPKKAGAFMLDWTSDCIKAFVDEYKYWDGHISKTAVCLFSVNKTQMEWVQTLGRLVGVGGNIRHSRTKTTFSGSSKEYETDYYTLQQNSRQWASGGSVKWEKEKVENEMVYCPTVPSSFFFVRRNGKICVTGNSNYYGTPWTAARSLKVPQKIMEEFQARYCRGGPGITPAFPAIARWWQWTAEQIQTVHKLTTPFGRTRHFFGRPGDDTTLREAIAFLPQSTTADRMNLGLWRVWKHMPQVQLLAQTYDSITFQFQDLGREYEAGVVAEALERIRVELTHPNGRKYVVPGEAKVGWNWGYASARNPQGLAKWSPRTPDPRARLTGLSKIAF
jgi:DNA polymerase I-like protein with 3'-5' exonuclease and polymerase domains